MFGNEMKKQKFKKQKRAENILKNENEKVVSTFSGLNPIPYNCGALALTSGSFMCIIQHDLKSRLFLWTE